MAEIARFPACSALYGSEGICKRVYSIAAASSMHSDGIPPQDHKGDADYLTHERSSYLSQLRFDYWNSEGDLCRSCMSETIPNSIVLIDGRIVRGRFIDYVRQAVQEWCPSNIVYMDDIPPPAGLPARRCVPAR